MDSHTPVLLNEVLSFLQPAPGRHYVDATFGRGGHSKALLEHTAPDGQLVVIDRDPNTLAKAKSLGSRVHALRGNFADTYELVSRDFSGLPISGVLLDGGISSTQLSDPTLGISFAVDAPLSMRLDRDDGMTAEHILNSWSEHDLADLLWRLGEERASRRIAAAIVRSRKDQRITRTIQLADIVVRAVGRRGRIHPATKTFQALRMEVNQELDNLSKGIEGALKLIARGGRLAVISFHSLEDRLVKLAFRSAAQQKNIFILLTKHPVVASRPEVLANPRSRSAKLRVIERLA